MLRKMSVLFRRKRSLKQWSDWILDSNSIFENEKFRRAKYYLRWSLFSFNASIFSILQLMMRKLVMLFLQIQMLMTTTMKLMFSKRYQNHLKYSHFLTMSKQMKTNNHVRHRLSSFQMFFQMCHRVL